MKEKYIEILKKVDANYSLMKTMRPLPQSGVDYFIREMGISVSHNSNALEGNTFTFDETRLLLEKGITNNARSFQEHEEIVGYKKGFDFLYRSLKENRAINEEFIKTLHAYVLHGNEEAGKYRTVQNYVGSLTKTVFVPCPPSQVEGKMQEYVERLQTDFEKNTALCKQENVDWESLFHSLAAHHIEFEKIHPFIDGNGRTGRLLLTYEMISMGLLPVDIRYEERERYNAALSSYDIKEKRSTRPESKTEKMANLLAECELQSMTSWNLTFAEYQTVQRKNDLAETINVGESISAEDDFVPTVDFKGNREAGKTVSNTDKDAERQQAATPISSQLASMVSNMQPLAAAVNGAQASAAKKSENINQ